MKINCVVIDANLQSVCVLNDCIKPFENEVDLVAKFDKPLLAFDFIREHKIDFVFVASEFKDTLGYQAVSKLENKPLFIITDSEAGGFFSNNTGYILTPAEYPDFFQAITSMRQSNLK